MNIEILDYSSNKLALLEMYIYKKEKKNPFVKLLLLKWF